MSLNDPYCNLWIQNTTPSMFHHFVVLNLNHRTFSQTINQHKQKLFDVITYLHHRTTLWHQSCYRFVLLLLLNWAYRLHCSYQRTSVSKVIRPTLFECDQVNLLSWSKTHWVQQRFFGNFKINSLALVDEVSHSLHPQTNSTVELFLFLIV